ncbi:MAG: hypothetical protein DRJ42_23070 [Deltaproteobacteria bacterium]|nr:MAG: hypothetical protein DRJ42_23070 [Deltaproteobacteria bacterium]
MNAEWRYVGSWLRREAGTKQDAGEACQYAMMRVSRGVDGLRAETPTQAVCWLRRVLRTGFSDVYRFANNEPVASALSKLSPKARDRELRRLEAPVVELSTSPGALDGFFDTLLDHVDEWLEVNVTRPMKRAGDRRRAEVALLHHVRKVSLDELRDMLGEAPSRDTLYKWFERGRDEVLLPTLGAWGARAELEDEEAAFVTTLQIILIATRRQKSRKPRRSRRTVRRAVSRGVSDTSVQ